MTGSYYFWKWADNDLPGPPLEVHAALLGGEMHPALQSFDATSLLEKLETVATKGRERGEEWDWEIVPQGAPAQARFVFVTCPRVNESKERVERFADEFVSLGLSGYDEQGGHLIPCMPPKLNCFITGQLPYEPAYDISLNDLPVLIRRITPGLRDPWGELLDQDRGVVAIATGRRYRVEWREYPGGKACGQFDQWRARDLERLAALAGADDTVRLPQNKDPDLLRFPDTLRIFEAFLRGEPRPMQYRWRNINRIVA